MTLHGSSSTIPMTSNAIFASSSTQYDFYYPKEEQSGFTRANSNHEQYSPPLADSGLLSTTLWTMGLFICFFFPFACTVRCWHHQYAVLRTQIYNAIIKWHWIIRWKQNAPSKSVYHSANPSDGRCWSCFCRQFNFSHRQTEEKNRANENT